MRRRLAAALLQREVAAARLGPGAHGRHGEKHPRAVGVDEELRVVVPALERDADELERARRRVADRVDHLMLLLTLESSVLQD